MGKIQVVSAGIPTQAVEAPQPAVVPVELSSIACVGFRKIGKSAYDAWLKPELDALGGVTMISFDAGTGRGAVSVKRESEEAVRQTIVAWGELDDECND